MRTRWHARLADRAARRDRWCMRRHGCGYEKYRSDREAAERESLLRAERYIAERVDFLRRSKQVREMQRSGHVHVLRAWRDLAFGPDGVVCRRAAEDFRRLCG
ncbi:hypothetical protein WJX74_005769 [Apatococcus lobatus]|uniref:Uncharacterized protein n=1 Tax=Apatococcus lobatus TaxID=904363 RepID=A0AAW1Q5J6_9CHLO